MSGERNGRRCTRFRVGRVSVYLHHGSWWIYYREDDKPIRRKIGSDRAAAEQAAAHVNAQLATAAPTLFGFKPIAIADLRAAFLREHESVRRSSLATISRYSAATQHLVDFSPKTKAHQVSASAFAEFLRNRIVSPNGHKNSPRRPLRDKGVQYILEVCRSLYAFAHRQRHLPPYSTNPFADLRVDLMRIDDAKPIFVFDSVTEAAFLSAARGWEFALQFTLAKTGLRPGELCHLLIEEVDLKEGWLHVRNRPELGWTIKTRLERSVPLIDDIRQVIVRTVGERKRGLVFIRPCYQQSNNPCTEYGREHLAKITLQRIHAEFQRDGQVPTRLVKAKIARTVWRDAGALDPDQVRVSFLRVCKRCGFPQATCVKSWRHTFATLLQDANVDPLIRQVTLGHKTTSGTPSLGMTEVYTHTRPETQKREITRALNQWPKSLALARKWLATCPR